MRGGDDVDDAARDGEVVGSGDGAEAGEETFGEESGGEVVYLEGELVAVGGELEGTGHDPGVMHEDVKGEGEGKEGVGEGADRREGGEVEGVSGKEGDEGVRVLGAHVLGGASGGGGIAAREDDARAAERERARRLEADAAVGARDDGDAAGERRGRARGGTGSTSAATVRLPKPLGPRQPARWPQGQRAALARSKRRHSVSKHPPPMVRGAGRRSASARARGVAREPRRTTLL